MDHPLIEEDIFVPPLNMILRDAKRCSSQEGKTARNYMQMVLYRALKLVQRTDERLCNPYDFDLAAIARHEAGESTLENVLRRDSDNDVRLTNVTFIASVEGDIRGSFTAYNIVGKSVMPMPGVVETGSLTYRQVNSEIMRFFLENETPLPVEEYRFPLRKGHTWAMSEEDEANCSNIQNTMCATPSGRSVADLGDHFIEEVGGVPVCMWRRP